MFLNFQEEPFDKNDASFIAELKKLAHDVEDSKSENWHHPSLIKLEPVEVNSVVSHSYPELIN